MNTHEILEIRNYLSQKRLSKIVLDEVLDHFVVQINDIMANENKGFQEAFLATKLSWKHELEMVRADFFSFRKIARIEQKILQNRFYRITLVSAIVAAFALGISLINEELIIYLQIPILLSLIPALGYLFVSKKINFRNYVNLSFHPLLLRTQIICFGAMFLLHSFNMDVNFDSVNFGSNFLLFCAVTQIQLLYLNSKKLNVLL